MAAQQFIHTPRAPQRPDAPFQHHRRYGADELRGVTGRGVSMSVYRIGTEPLTLAIDTWRDGASAGMRISLDADSALELARCLIDAAADIEAHQGGTATQTAAAEVPA